MDEHFLGPPLKDDTELSTCKEDLIEELGARIEAIAKQVEELPESNHADVGHFHHKFGLPNTTHEGVYPRLVDEAFMKFRSEFLHEELREFDEALVAGDLVKTFDALLDLVYVALGTAHVLGLPWQAGWTEVQRANMAKERASADKVGTRPWQFDVRKPAGWTPPDLSTVLERFGWTEDLLKFPPIKVSESNDEQTNK